MQNKAENQSKDKVQVNVEKLNFDINGNETSLNESNENEKPQNIWNIEPAAGDYEIQENSGLNPLYLRVQLIETILNVKSIISSQFAADEAAVALQDRSNSSQETEIPFQISRKAETISITFENEDDSVVEGNTNQYQYPLLFWISKKKCLTMLNKRTTLVTLKQTLHHQILIQKLKLKLKLKHQL